MSKRGILGMIFAVMAVVSALCLPSFFVKAEPALPVGFTLERITTGQSAGSLTGFEMLPGGAITTGKCGLITFVPTGGIPRTLTTIATECRHDMGVVGFSLAADFASSRRVYTLYTYQGSDEHRYARLSYWTLNSATAPTTMSGEQIVPLGTILEDALSHGPGTVVAAPDGSLFVGFGDAASFTAVDQLAHRAQSPDQPYGKILRINPQGQGVPGNPYYDAANPSSWRSRVYAMGMRNPFRFSLNPTNGRLYIGDVGWGAVEEQNVAVAGSNFGWPCYEGTAQTNGYKTTPYCQADYAAGVRHDDPFYSYPHNGRGAAAVGGVFTTSESTYPAQYKNVYFVGDYARDTITVLRPNANDQLTSSAEAFGSNIGAPVDFELDPATGEVLFADIASGNVFKVRYAPGNRPPTAVATISPTLSSPNNRTVAFDASASYDLDGDLLSYSWDFGDGATGTGKTTTHTYTSATARTVTLRVSDGRTTTTDTLTVYPANHVPTIQLASPPIEHRFAVGETVSLSATAADSEDGTLTPAIQWQAILLHCPSGGACHQHPSTTGLGEHFVDQFTDHGGDTKMQIIASVTDQTGATTQVSYMALPDVHTFSVTSPSPASINGLTTTTWQAVTGEQLTVAVPVTHLSATFTRWVDGVTVHNRTLFMPAANLTISAEYDNAIQNRYNTFGAAALGSPTGNETALGSGSWRPYQRGGIYWRPGTGALVVYGGIYNKFIGMGGAERWGFPLADEQGTAEGRYSQFERLFIGWTAAHGAHAVLGGNLGKYLALGGPTHVGLPITDEIRNADNRGTAQHFTPNTPAGRSIYFYPGIGSYGVFGAIRATWASLGYERSRLGYPVSDEYGVGTKDRRSKFQHGYITWHASTKRTTVTYY